MLPSDAAMGLDRPKMLIALGRAGFTQNRPRARRYDHPRRGMSLQHLVVDWVAIVSAIGCYRTDRVLDLIQQIRQCRDVADIVRSSTAAISCVSASTARCSLRQRRRERIPCF